MNGPELSRRNFLGALGAALLASGPARSRAFSEPTGDDDIAAMVRERAYRLSLRPFVPAPPAAGDLTYDQYRAIRFDPAQKLWLGSDTGFAADFFHVGGLYKKAVELHEVVDGKTRPIAYRRDLFDFGHEAEAVEAVAGPAFAGLRLHYPMDGAQLSEFAVFLGASYFRAISQSGRYGLSARGLAIRSGLEREEFPDFTAFWLERPRPGVGSVVVHALLDGPSVAGAYRFVLSPGEPTLMDVSLSLFARRQIEHLGIAPLTSMFMRGEADRGPYSDFRPQIHDSEGLSIRRGPGDVLWRPLQNPDEVTISRYEAARIEGFGLVQRDRDFSHYLDLEARYDLRPDLWVEPIGRWGPGEVRLVELPTPDETQDNIVAFWTPAEPPEPNEAFTLAYRLSWGLDASPTTRLARVTGTHTGVGGIASSPDPTLRKFVLDFVGGRFEAAGPVEIETVATGAEIVAASALRNEPMDGWRAVLDVRGTFGETTEISCALRQNGTVATEVWTTVWRPGEDRVGTN